MARMARHAVAAAIAIAAGWSIVAQQPALAAYPGSNGAIVFASDRAPGGGVHLFTMTQGGGSVTQLTSGAVIDRDPVFSPGGTRIAFTRYLIANPSHGEIYVMNADGTALRKLTNNSDDDFAPSFRADGALIVFASDRSGNYDLYTMNLDGSGVTRITSNTSDDITPAYFANDLDHVYYSTTTGNMPRRHIRQLRISNRTTGEISHPDASLSESDTYPDAHPINDFDPFISSTYQRFTCGSSTCWTEVQTAPEPRPTTGGPHLESGPAFSSDGQSIWYASNANDPDPDHSPDVIDIWRMAIDGTGRTRVTSNTSSFSIDPNMQPIPEFQLVDARFSSFESSIQQVVGAGIALGCDQERYCPVSSVTRGQMAAFLARALELPPTDVDYFTDDDESTFEASINKIAEAEIAFGCTDTTFCPSAPVTRGQMAAFLDRAFIL